MNFNQRIRKNTIFSRKSVAGRLPGLDLVYPLSRITVLRVYLAETRACGDLVAVKEVGLSKKIEKQSIFREIEVMRGFNHKNVLKCLSFDASEDRVQIILEYCPLGSLADLILVG